MDDSMKHSLLQDPTKYGISENMLIQFSEKEPLYVHLSYLDLFTNEIDKRPDAVVEINGRAALYLVSENIKEGEIIWFIIKTILVVLLALFLTSLFLSFSREFEFLKNKLLPANIRKFVNKYTIGIGSVLVMGISISLSILCI